MTTDEDAADAIRLIQAIDKARDALDPKPSQHAVLTALTYLVAMEITAGAMLLDAPVEGGPAWDTAATGLLAMFAATVATSVDYMRQKLDRKEHSLQ